MCDSLSCISSCATVSAGVDQGPIPFPLKKDMMKVYQKDHQNITGDEVPVVRTSRQMFLILAACAEEMQPWPLERDKLNEVY